MSLKNMSTDHILEKAVQVTSQVEANEMLDSLIKECQANNRYDYDEASEKVRSSLGYFAGYYDDKTRERVEALYNCVHPIFGSIEKQGSPDPSHAFKLGQVCGALKEFVPLYKQPKAESPISSEIRKLDI